ncbi:leucyl aminopeptidase [Chloroflexia bacterium SDU3-3]|nr:leucyl aminopeptidase [Chloroflexia bacterium SDU3-3]
MNISINAAEPFGYQTPLLALATWEGETLPEAIAPLIEAGDWTGKAKQSLVIYPRGAVAASRVLLVGLGPKAAVTSEKLRVAAATAATRAREIGVDSFALALAEGGPIGPRAAGQALAEGATLALYRFDTYRTGLSPEQTRSIESLTILAPSDTDEVSAGAAVGQAIAAGTSFARDLINHPGNVVVPAKLGETALDLGKEFGFKVTVLDKAQLEAQGFGGIIGVGKGSANEPRFITIEYGSKQPGVPTICLVGKGITFDTGGISIKPGERMQEMISDMSGAAAVLGTLRVIGALKLPLHIVGLISTAENMPSSTAYKPGDILTTLSGKTIEVLNTDAEGRIVLADALYYAQRYEPDAIIDLATLTGAIVVALGTYVSGMMTNSDSLADRLSRAGQETHERVWRMPLWEEYLDQTRSEVADLKNTGGRPGGALTAAAFLSQFVGEYPWAHLDIAGTAYSERAMGPYTPRGGAGVGVRLLTQMLVDWAGGDA